MKPLVVGAPSGIKNVIRKLLIKNVKADESTKVNKATCDHQWEGYGISTAGPQYICKKCGKIETRPTDAVLIQY